MAEDLQVHTDIIKDLLDRMNSPSKKVRGGAAQFFGPRHLHDQLGLDPYPPGRLTLCIEKTGNDNLILAGRGAKLHPTTEDSILWLDAFTGLTLRLFRRSNALIFWSMRSSYEKNSLTAVRRVLQRWY